MRIAAILLAGAALTACNTTNRVEPAPRIVVQEVVKQVAVSCVPDSMPEEPTYVDSNAALRSAAGPEDRYQLVIAGREQRDSYLAKVRPVLRGCKG